MYKSLATLAATLSVAMAKTPTGFQPGSNTDLMVDYNGLMAMNGANVAKQAVQTQPTLATVQKLTGTSFAVIMIDLDIPTNNPPATNTLLHWLQTDLTVSSTATALNTTMGRTNAFLLQNEKNTAALAPYIGPSPPARIPLSHRYTQILVDTTGASASALDALKSAAATRQGFSAEDVLTAAGLADKVVAGNFFNVTNAGPVGANSTATTTGGSGSASGSAGGGASSSTAPTSTAPISAAAGAHGVPLIGAAVCVLGAVGLFLGL